MPLQGRIFAMRKRKPDDNNYYLVRGTITTECHLIQLPVTLAVLKGRLRYRRWVALWLRSRRRGPVRS